MVTPSDDTPNPEISESSDSEQASVETPGTESASIEATPVPTSPIPTEAVSTASPTEPQPATEAKPKIIKEKASKAKKEAGKLKGGASVSLSLDDGVEKPKIVKAKGSKNVLQGIAHVLASFNNTIVSITDLRGQVIGWSSSGKCGFKGSRKSTAYAAQLVAQDACRQAMGHGVREVEVRVKGPGAGRESAVRAIQAIGLEINLIRDVTPVPHNGCRPPKQRRV